MTDDDLSELKEQTTGGDRIETAQSEQCRRELVDDLVDALVEIERGDGTKAVSAWDGPTAAYLTVVDAEDTVNPEARAALVEGIQEKLDTPVDDDAGRSELIRLLIRLGLRTVAPEHVDALRDALREQAADGL